MCGIVNVLMCGVINVIMCGVINVIMCGVINVIMCGIINVIMYGVIHGVMCGVTAPNKPTAEQLPLTRSEAPLNMKTMYKHVVSRLSPYWITVGDYLEYTVVERNSFRAANNNKSLTALLENWIITDNGRKPKTWSTFIEVLEVLDQDLCISVGREISASLGAEVFLRSGE